MRRLNNVLRGDTMPFIICMCVFFLGTAVWLAVKLSGGRKARNKRMKERGFEITRNLCGLYIDDKHRKWYVNSPQYGDKLFDFSDIIDCKIYGESSFVTGMYKKGVYIYTRGGEAVYAAVGESKNGCSDFMHDIDAKAANNIYAAVMSMMTEAEAAPRVSGDAESQLKKLKELLEKGLITSADYEAKKRQILGL